MTVNPAKTSRHVEVERKFEVPESVAPPSFEGIAEVNRVEQLPLQTLAAVYFDTAANDLAANRITLRRRTGGPDAGWHLKLPAGPDSRTEVHAPLGPAADVDPIPGELLDVVLAIVRDRPLAPVARMTTARAVHLLYGHDDAALAEFCDDRVTAQALVHCGAPSSDGTPAEQQWREWELELLKAQADTALLDRLGDRLLDAGAAPAGHGSKLARVLDTASARGSSIPATPVRQAVDELLVWDRAVRADADDAVHQMRVRIRKLRRLLKTSPPSGAADRDWIIRRLGQLGAVLETVDGAEALAQRYQQALDALPVELVRGRVRERLVDVKERYRDGLRDWLVALRSARYFRLLDALDAVAAEPVTSASDQAPGGEATDAVDINELQRAIKAAAQAAESDDDGALRRIRKYTKRIRSIAAAAGATHVAERAKLIRALLDVHRDSVRSREYLLQQATTAAAAGEETFTYGLLYQQETDVADRSRQQLDAALRTLDSEGSSGAISMGTTGRLR